MHVLKTAKNIRVNSLYLACTTKIWLPESFNRLTTSLWVMKIWPIEIRSIFLKSGLLTSHDFFFKFDLLPTIQISHTNKDRANPSNVFGSQSNKVHVQYMFPAYIITNSP